MLRQRGCLLVLSLVAVVAAACASTSESTRAVATADLGTLAGTWQGTASGAQGLSQPMTMVLSPDGSYTMTGGTGGVFMSQGTAEVKDGKVVFTSRGTTGGQTADRVITAVFSERSEPSQVVLVLTGSGTSAGGPVSFSVSRPKR